MSEIIGSDWIETTEPGDERREWISIALHSLGNHPAWISISRKYEQADGRVRTDPEAGISFDVAKLDKVIGALASLRSPQDSPRGSR